MDFKISQRVIEKLKTKHGIERSEIPECFCNRTGSYFTDTRLDHQTDPPTYWFVAPTDKGRLLKVVFMRYPDYFEIKTAFVPTDGSDALYERLCAQQGPTRTPR
ncbi:MAG: ADP-ribosyl-(dinitrogen reductase) hydrolase [Steroidobacteraceae bacterium]|jgi:hypothetical protein